MTSELKNILNSPQPDPEEVRRLASRYPYFIAPMVRLVRSGVSADPELLEHLGSRVALNLSSRADRVEILGEDGGQFDDFYPAEPQPKRPDTATAIDTFIDRFGPADPRELDVMTRHIFGSEPSGEPKSSEPPVVPTTPESTLPLSSEETSEILPETNDNTSPKLMQSLAMVMVRQHNYSKALEIINQLSLKYPEKRFIFADQIRFLRKLIENDNQVNSK